MLSSQKQLGKNLQAASTVIERHHCSRLHLRRSRVPGVHTRSACTRTYAGASWHSGFAAHKRKFVEQAQKQFLEMKGVGMANQQKGVQQETAWCSCSE